MCNLFILSPSFN